MSKSVTDFGLAGLGGITLQDKIMRGIKSASWELSGSREVPHKRKEKSAMELWKVCCLKPKLKDQVACCSNR